MRAEAVNDVLEPRVEKGFLIHQVPLAGRRRSRIGTPLRLTPFGVPC
jgi:hypothetical protein